MTTKHTPGPWAVATKTGSSGGIAHATGYIAFTAIPRKVSEDREDGEGWLDMRERTQSERDAVAAEERANARLIAAAPEMLAALIKAEVVLLELEQMTSGGDDEICIESEILTVRDAIAKATGEQT